MRYVLDSNVLLHYIRNTNSKEHIEETYRPFGEENTAIISIVAVAEIMSIAKRYKWGERKLKVAQKLFDSLVIVEIRYSDLINVYSEIDAFSQGKLRNIASKFSSRNMGKNDLWIASTTQVSKAKLITSDNDFDHLNTVYFEVLKF